MDTVAERLREVHQENLALRDTVESLHLRVGGNSPAPTSPSAPVRQIQQQSDSQQSQEKKSKSSWWTFGFA